MAEDSRFLSVGRGYLWSGWRMGAERGQEGEGAKREGTNEREKMCVCDVKWTNRHSIWCRNYKRHIDYKKVKAPSTSGCFLGSHCCLSTTMSGLPQAQPTSQLQPALTSFHHICHFNELMELILIPKVQLKTSGIRWVIWPTLLYRSLVNPEKKHKRRKKRKRKHGGKKKTWKAGEGPEDPTYHSSPQSSQGSKT